MSSVIRDRSGWRFIVTRDQEPMHLEHSSWDDAFQHLEYLHRAYKGHGFIFGITKFYRRKGY